MSEKALTSFTLYATHIGTSRVGHSN